MNYTTCTTCAGSGKTKTGLLFKKTCWRCKGTGRIERTATLRTAVPTEENTTIHQSIIPDDQPFFIPVDFDFTPDPPSYDPPTFEAGGGESGGGGADGSWSDSSDSGS